MKAEEIYKVVVVEDEPKILRNIIQKIEKANPLFRVVGSASNGEDAIQIITSNKPHVLFTDIKMPKMDGLELIKRVKNDNPHMQIIILSGYSEFEYAQQSIKLGVKDYLLKPVEEESISETLNSVKARLDATISSIERNVLFSDINGMVYNSSLPYLFNDSRYVMLLLCIGNLCSHLSASSLHKLYRGLWDSIPWERILSSVLNANCKWWIVDEKQPNQKFLIISSSDIVPDEINVLAARLMCALSEVITSYSINICISEQDISYSEIWDFAQKLRIILDHGLIMGKSTVITPRNLEMSDQLPTLIDTSILNRFTVLLQSGNRNLLLQELSNLLNKWSLVKYPQRILEKGLYQLIRHCYSQTTSVSEVEISHIEYELSEKFAVLKDFQSIYEDVRYIFDNMLVSDNKDIDTAEELANRIEDYIKAHFTELISLEDISRKFNISVSYITKIFKKYRGETFLQLIITLRINEAKRLMAKHPEFDIKGIGEMIGYYDQHYFSRIFKNVTGMSPSEFKDQVNIKI